MPTQVNIGHRDVGFRRIEDFQQILAQQNHFFEKHRADIQNRALLRFLGGYGPPESAVEYSETSYPWRSRASKRDTVETLSKILAQQNHFFEKHRADIQNRAPLRILDGCGPPESAVEYSETSYTWRSRAANLGHLRINSEQESRFKAFRTRWLEGSV